MSPTFPRSSASQSGHLTWLNKPVKLFTDASSDAVLNHGDFCRQVVPIVRHTEGLEIYQVKHLICNFCKKKKNLLPIRLKRQWKSTMIQHYSKNDQSQSFNWIKRD